MYDKGQGIQQDYNQAAFWYLKAAIQNNAMAQFAIAELFNNDLVDMSESNKFSIAKMIRDESDETRSDRQAAMWYLRAANNRLPRAQYTVGLLYAKGESGFTRDYVQAYKWLSLAGDIAGNSREWVAGKMTPEQIEKAKILAEKFRVDGH